MILAVSPYHLTTREPAAMAALLLADRVVTVLPTPAAGISKPAVRAALKHCPRYARMLESWRWSSALWRAGVVFSAIDGEEAMTDVRNRCQQIAVEPGYAPLRPYLHPGLFDHGDELLEAVAADVLKGGPDPGISVPLTAGLDAFAARHGIAVARATGDSQARRGSGPSLAQRAEQLMGKQVFSLALPILTSAGGESLLRAREILREPLAALRSVIDAALCPGSDAPACERAARNAAGAVGQMLNASGELAGDDEWGRRITEGTVRLTCRRMPGAAVIQSSLAALATAGRFGAAGRPSSNRPAEAGKDGARSTEPSEVVTLSVSMMAGTTLKA